MSQDGSVRGLVVEGGLAENAWRGLQHGRADFTHVGEKEVAALPVRAENFGEGHRIEGFGQGADQSGGEDIAFAGIANAAGHGFRDFQERHGVGHPVRMVERLKIDAETIIVAVFEQSSEAEAYAH